MEMFYFSLIVILFLIVMLLLMAYITIKENKIRKDFQEKMERKYLEKKFLVK